MPASKSNSSNFDFLFRLLRLDQSCLALILLSLCLSSQICLIRAGCCPAKTKKGRMEVLIYAQDASQKEDKTKPFIYAKSAVILSKEPDSIITCLEAGNYEFEGGTNNCLVVKQVRSKEFFKDRSGWFKKAVLGWYYEWVAKPVQMVKHELNMFEMFKHSLTGDYGPAVRLIAGLRYENWIVLIMPMGETLSSAIERNFEDDSHPPPTATIQESNTQNHDLAAAYKDRMYLMIKQIAETLNQFHTKALHLHLKPGNWLLVPAGQQQMGNDDKQLKLIDLQTALPIDWAAQWWADRQIEAQIRIQKQMLSNTERLRKVEKLDFSEPPKIPISPESEALKTKAEDIELLAEFACNSLWNEKLVIKMTGAITANLRPSTYASPEHVEACEAIKYLKVRKARLGENMLALKKFLTEMKRFTRKKFPISLITPDLWRRGLCGSGGSDVSPEDFLSDCRKRVAVEKDVDTKFKRHVRTAQQKWVAEQLEQVHREMAKELEKIKKKSDIWAVGILLLEMLAHAPVLLLYKAGIAVKFGTKLFGKLRGKNQTQILVAQLFAELREQFTNPKVIETQWPPASEPAAGEWSNEEKKKMPVAKIVEYIFPEVYDLLRAIFNWDPDKRPGTECFSSFFRQIVFVLITTESSQCTFETFTHAQHSMEYSYSLLV